MNKAQDHLVRDEGVAGSNPATPTNTYPKSKSVAPQDAPQLASLIDRLERATGPDGALDAAIDCCIRFPDLRPAEPDDHLEYQKGVPPSPSNIWCPTGFLLAAPYTSSIAAAATLFPEGWEWALHHEAGAYQGQAGDPALGIDTSYVPTGGIALAIVALRARLRETAD